MLKEKGAKGSKGEYRYFASFRLLPFRAFLPLPARLFLRLFEYSTIQLRDFYGYCSIMTPLYRTWYGLGTEMVWTWHRLTASYRWGVKKEEFY